MTNDEFNDIVTADVRGHATGEQIRLLRQDENIERWYDALLILKRDVEAQFCARQADLFDKQARFLDGETDDDGRVGDVAWVHCKGENSLWKTKTLRFLGLVERRIAEARQLRRTQRTTAFIEALQADRRHFQRRMLRLEEAIIEHRTHRCGETCTDEMCVADTELWAAVA